MSEKETTKLYNGSTGIDADSIKEAQTETPCRKARSPVWIKWGIMAACLCVVLAAMSVPHILNSMQDEENGAGENSTSEVIATKMTFEAKVTEVQDNALIVEPLMGTPERDLSDSIAIDTENLAELTTCEYVARAQGGDRIKVCYLKENSNISIGEIDVCQIIPLEEVSDEQ